ncbi:MAG: sigma-70 family RNA polymerase sigma factor [Niabella sp.]
MQLLKDGDDVAYGQIYRRYYRELLAYAQTQVKLQDWAEDLVHEVFIKIWDNRSKIALDKNFRSYLFRICHNQAFDFQHEIAKNRSLLEELIKYYQPHEDDLPKLSPGALDYTQVMEEALSGLTEQRRRIYLMSKVEKKGYIQIGRELGISPNTVRNHMVQIREILKDYLRTRGIHFLVLFILLDHI